MMITGARVARFLLPYCLQRLNDGCYLALNRQYKPLGVFTTDWVDYETHPSALRIRITPATAKALSCNGDANQDRIYLYNDGNPFDDPAYFARLNRLARLKVDGKWMARHGRPNSATSCPSKQTEDAFNAQDT